MPELVARCGDGFLDVPGVTDVSREREDAVRAVWWRSRDATRAPSACSRRATAAPMPLDPPVTSATSPRTADRCPRSQRSLESERRGLRPSRDYPLGTQRPDLVSSRRRRRADGRHAGRSARRSVRRGGDSRDAGDAAHAGRGRGRRRPHAARRESRAGGGARCVPDDLLLEICTAPRPRRATAAELEEWAARLAGLDAPRGLPRSCARPPLRTPSEGSSPMASSRRFSSARHATSTSSSSSLRCRSSGSSQPTARTTRAELVVEDGAVARMDGRAAADFDVIDRFVVAHGLDLGSPQRRWRATTSSWRGCSSTSTSACGARPALARPDACEARARHRPPRPG